MFYSWYVELTESGFTWVLPLCHFSVYYGLSVVLPFMAYRVRDHRPSSLGFSFLLTSVHCVGFVCFCRGGMGRPKHHPNPANPKRSNPKNPKRPQIVRPKHKNSPENDKNH